MNLLVKPMKISAILTHSSCVDSGECSAINIWSLFSASMQLRAGLPKEMKIGVSLSCSFSTSILQFLAATLTKLHFLLIWFSIWMCSRNLCPTFPWKSCAFPQDQPLPPSTGSWHLTLRASWRMFHLPLLLFGETRFSKRKYERTPDFEVWWFLES